MHKYGRARLPMVGMACAILLSSIAFAKEERIYPPPVCLAPLMPDSNTAEENMVWMGDLEITYDQQVFWKNKRVLLSYNLDPTRVKSDQLLRLLLALVDGANTALSIPELYEDVWIDKNPDSDSMDREVREAIFWLRRSFEAVDSSFNRIETMRNAGYLWNDRTLIPDLENEEMSITVPLRKLIWKNHVKKLSPGQFRLTWLLIRERGKTVSYETLYRAYMDSESVQRDKTEMSHIIRTEIGVIRKILKEFDPAFDRIQNVRGEGMTWKPRLSLVN